MKKYNVVVNGNTYEVEVEEVGGVVTSAPVPKAAPAAKTAPAPKAAPAPKTAPAAAPSEGEEVVTAPMPGTVLDIKVSVGDTVSNGDVVIILEAMKMENEIMSPVDGKIVSVNVSNGASVNSDDVLIVIG